MASELREVLPGEELPEESNAWSEEEAGEAVEAVEAVPDPLLAGIDRNRVLELGDRILIEFGEKERVWGQVYYRDNELLRLRPDMPGNTLMDFPRDYNPDDLTDKFKDELGVTRSFILTKRRVDRPDFIRQQDFQVGQTLVGILADGKEGPIYTIKSLNEEEDEMVVVNTESKEETTLLFHFCGIPLDQEIQLLRIDKPRIQKEEEGAAKSVAPPPVEEEGVEGAADTELFEADDDEIEDEGYVIVPQEQIVQEAIASKMIIPEALQKAHAINDFLNLLPVEDRKNPKLQRNTRILVELLQHMKREITDYYEDNTVKGVKKPSVSTLLELIERVDVPMGRPVLDIEKRLYVNYKKEDAIPVSRDNRYFLEDDILAAKDAAGQSPFASSFVDTGGEGASQINYYVETQIQYEKEERSWKRGEGSGPEFPIRKDTFIFRSIIPDLTEDATLEGLKAVHPEDRKFPFFLVSPPMGFLRYGIETALTTTYRKSGKSQKAILIPEESAPLNFYLLFPQKAEAFLGTKRSGSLALDSMRGKEAMAWMEAILTLFGSIDDANTSDKIVPLKVEGSTLSANIPITDYLSGLELMGTGIGDLQIDLGNYGLGQVELSPEIYAMLQEKIEIYQTDLITSLNALREAIPKIPEPESGSMLPIETTSILDERIRPHPLLVTGLETFEAQNPRLRLSDVARVAYFLKYYTDYWQVAIGPVEIYKEEERLKTIKSNYLDRIANEQLILHNTANRGLPPTPNTCEHVAKLVTIRKIKEESERLLALTKFLAHYQSGTPREDNWISCNLCQKNLLCVHERLLIMAFLSPLEKEIIFKKIHLNFSGGVFQGYYICRSCGQPIQEIGLDTSIQFDKQGRPISGQAALKTKDGPTLEDIEKVMGSSLVDVEVLEFEDKEEAYLYSVLRELAERVGIYMDRESYETMIDNVKGYLGLLPDKKRFLKKQAKYKAANPTYVIPDYDVIMAKQTIGSAAIFLLYEIQTHIPEYEAKYPLPGCDAGFGGYPLEENKESRQGLTYIACAIASIQREEEPWSSAVFYKVPKGGDKEKQIQTILEFMMPVLSDIEKSNTSLERLLDEKRMWKAGQLGARASVMPVRLKDSVPHYFLPELVLPTVTEAAAEPVVAMDVRNAVKAWIRNAHALARTGSASVRGSPIADITCCKIPVNAPGSFWAAQGASLSPVPLNGRVLTPFQRAPAQQFKFGARNKEALIVEMPKALTYRLFTKVCYEGDRMGESHEPGVTHRCHSCGFQFPVHPSIMDPDQAQSAVSKADIDTSVETFQELLQIVQEKHEVEPMFLGDAENWSKKTLVDIGSLEYPPFANWELCFTTVIERLKVFKKSVKADAIEPGTIAELLAQTQGEEVSLPQLAADGKAALAAAFEKIKFKDPKIRELKLAILDRIANLPWHNFIQVLETYFLRVGKNLLYHYDINKLKAYKNKALADITVTNIKESFERNNVILAKHYAEFSKKTFAKQKMAKFLAQLTGIIRLKNRVRASYFVGGQTTFKWIQLCFFYGPMAELVDSMIEPFEDIDEVPEYILPREVPEEGAEEEEAVKESARASLNDSSIKTLLAIVNDISTLFQQYQLSYNDDQLKQILEERAEKEKQVMLGSLQAMSPEQKNLHKLQRLLGIGEFGIDIIKQVVRYNKGQVKQDTNVLKAAGVALSVSGANLDDMDNEDDMDDDGDDERVRIVDPSVAEALRQADQAYDNEDEGEFGGEGIEGGGGGEGDY